MASLFHPRTAPLASPATGSLVLVLNGHASGIADPERLGADLAARAQELGAGARALVTHSQADLWDVLEEAGLSGERVALVGGDGSLHAAANAPLRALPELALIPAGRANNIARALGVPTKREAALATAVQATPRALDALRVTTPMRSLYAVEGVSAGFHASARAGYRAENSADVKQGLIALEHALLGFEPYEVAAVVDSEERIESRDAAQLFLSNLPYFAYGFRVDPAADPSDGRLEAILFHASRRTTLVRLLAAAHGGRHVGRREVELRSAREVELTRPIPLVADAVPLGTTTAFVAVAPARLHVAAPAPAGGAA